MIDLRETQVIYKCDVCGKPDAESCQFVVSGADPWRADLCKAHVREILAVMDHGAQVPKRTRKPPTPMLVKKRRGT